LTKKWFCGKMKIEKNKKKGERINEGGGERECEKYRGNYNPHYLGNSVDYS